MKRYEKLDYLRGIIFISMVIYHGCWDAVYFLGWNISWYEGLAGRLWQQSICWGFILLAGFCWSFGKNKWANGGKLLAAGTLITLVTMVILPEYPVYFGILTFLGAAGCLMAVAEPLLGKKLPLPCAFINMLLFFFFYHCNKGYLGWKKTGVLLLPEGLYQNWLTAFLGFPFPGFLSSDYFPVIPWIFLYLTGHFFHEWLVKKQQGLEILKTAGGYPVQWIGRHSLLLYMIHQPALYVLVLIIDAAGDLF